MVDASGSCSSCVLHFWTFHSDGTVNGDTPLIIKHTNPVRSYRRARIALSLRGRRNQSVIPKRGEFGSFLVPSIHYWILEHYPKPGSIGAKLLFFLSVVFSSFLLGGGLWLLIGDTAYPPQIIEGKVDRTFTRYRIKDNYSAIIDGRRYTAIHDAYADLHVGDRVRVEIGAGSKVIFRVERLSSP